MTSNAIPLFRLEAIKQLQSNNEGEVFINTPISYTTLSACSMVIIALLILFICFAEFSEKIQVTGYLNTARGIVRLYTTHPGIMLKSYVQAGSHVKKGDDLFIIDIAYFQHQKNHNIMDNLQKKKALILHEIQYKTKVLKTLKKLLTQKYISLHDYNQQREEIVELKTRKNSLELEVMREQQSVQHTITAPIDGIVANLNTHVGQYVTADKPLIKIIPHNTKLVAELFVPINQARFLHKKNNVVLRYDTYPFTRFGVASAVIKDISATPSLDSEDDKPLEINQPYYKVIAALEKQSITIYDTEKALGYGMTLSAVIMGPKRKIWQWLFLPLSQVHS